MQTITTKSRLNRHRFGTYALLMLVSTVAAIAFPGCSDKYTHNQTTMIEPINKSDLQRVAGLRILFAHQSVGGNILDGVHTLAADKAVALQVTEAADLAPSTPGMFHFQIGTNGNPEGKISDFQAVFHDKSPNLDIAMLKLCYIDFNAKTDSAAIAKRYIHTIESLQARYPQTKFVAVTTPLTTVQTGPKAWIKKILGKTPAGVADNAARYAFNEGLRAHFPTDRLFDVAKIEANADGAADEFEYLGQRIEVLSPSITSDGGHLNAKGQRIVASELLMYLSGTPPSK
jgi:hypothetical protein